MAKRAAEDGASGQDPKVARTEGDDPTRDAQGSRLAKRKVAIFFGYCGSGYSGLQMYVAFLTQQPRRADD